VAGDAPGVQREPERHFLLNLDAPERDPVDDGLVVTALVEDEADIVEKLRMCGEKLFGAAEATRFFVGDGEENNVAAERQLPPLDLDERHRLGDTQ